MQSTWHLTHRQHSTHRAPHHPHHPHPHHPHHPHLYHPIILILITLIILIPPSSSSSSPPSSSSSSVHVPNTLLLTPLERASHHAAICFIARGRLKTRGFRALAQGQMGSQCPILQCDRASQVRSEHGSAPLMMLTQPAHDHRADQYEPKKVPKKK